MSADPGKQPIVRTWLQWRGFRIYRHDLGDYMQRWILQTPWGALRVHHILRSDAGTDLHDHPFDFWSLLLTGGYEEIRALGPLVESQWYPRLSLVRRRAEDLHRLIVPSPVWTLVWAGPRRRGWGFQTPDGWVSWREYVPTENRDALWHAANAKRAAVSP